MSVELEMNYCRRCEARLVSQRSDSFKCQNGHMIYADSYVAIALFLYNNAGEIVVIERGIEPGKDRIDFPGGFCESKETPQQAIYREKEEEIGINPSQYSAIKFLHSAIDRYEYGGEVLPVTSLIYKAKLMDSTSAIKASDDAKYAWFMKPEDVEIDKIYFDSVREALTMELNVNKKERLAR